MNYEPISASSARKILGVSTKTPVKRIQKEDFEKKYLEKVDKICVIQHCNIGGEYFFNHFYLDNNLYIFDSNTNYWKPRKDFPVSKCIDKYVAILTKSKTADVWRAKIKKLEDEYREKHMDPDNYLRIKDAVDMYNFNPELAYVTYGITFVDAWRNMSPSMREFLMS